MFLWATLMLFLMAFWINAWPLTVRNELFLLGLHNHSEMPLAMLQQPHGFDANSYCWLLLVQLQSAQCPFMKLLLHSLVTLLVYNLALILIGYRLHKSASCRAKRLLLMLKPRERRLSLARALITTTTTESERPPLPPPRCKRRTAPKPPSACPTLETPFKTMQVCLHPDQYQSLRKNLERVLEGLQQPQRLALPPPHPPPPSRTPPPRPSPTPSLSLSLCNASHLHKLSEQSLTPVLAQEMPKHKAKSRKLFRKLLKRLGKPFAKKEANEVCINSNSNSNKSGILHPIWQRFKFRYGRKQRSELQLPTSSSESNCSSVCLYAYREVCST